MSHLTLKPNDPIDVQLPDGDYIKLFITDTDTLAIKKSNGAVILFGGSGSGGIYSGSGLLSQSTVVNGLAGYSLGFEAVDNFSIAANIFRLASMGGINYGTFDVSGLTDQRTYTLQDSDGELAFISDIQAAGFDNVLFVAPNGISIANGATKGSLSKKFIDIDEAISVAVSGDIVVIVGGIYSSYTNLAKDGVKIIGVNNPTIKFFGTTALADNGSQMTIDVKGDITFDITGTNKKFMDVDNVLTKFNIKCKSVTVNGGAARGIDSSGGTVDSVFEATDFFHTTGTSGNIYTIQLSNFAEGTFICPKISTDNTTTVLNSTISMYNMGGNPKIIGDIYGKSESNGAASFSVVMISGTSNNGGTLTINGNVYQETVTSPTGFWGTAAIRTIQFGNLVIRGDIYSLDKHAILADSSGSTTDFEGKIYTTGALAPINLAVDQILKIRNSEIHTDLSLTAIQEAGSLAKLILENTKIYQNHEDGGATVSCINIGGSANIIMDNVKMVMNVASGTPESITTGDPKNIKILGNVFSNVDKSADVTNIITGTSFVFDSDIE